MDSKKKNKVNEPIFEPVYECDLSALVAGITPENRHGAIDLGAELGEEKLNWGNPS